MCYLICNFFNNFYSWLHFKLRIIIISIYQISGWQFSRVLIGSRNLEYPWLFTVLRTERKMARRFAKVSDEEIVAINEATFFIPLIW